MNILTLLLHKLLHKRRTGKVLLCLLCGALLAMPAMAADDAADYESKLQTLKQNISALQRELEAVKGEHSKLERELKDSEVEIGEQLKKIDSTHKKIQQQNHKLNELQTQKQSLHKQRKSQQTQIATQVQSAYQAGPQSQIRLLLNQESPESLMRFMKYHDYVLSARSSKLEQYLAILSQLDVIEPQILLQKNELTSKEKQLNSHQQLLTLEQKKRKQALSKLKRLIANKDDQLLAQDRNRTHLQHFLNEMTATVSQINLPVSGQLFSRSKGRMLRPANGTLRHRFGSTRVRGKLKWEGMVISARAGTPVMAIHSGRVIFADYLRGQGLLLIIDHGEGYLSLYAHNQSLFRQTGDLINAGDTIAHIGESGGQDYSGLYFEIRHNGRPTNPAPWLRKA